MAKVALLIAVSEYEPGLNSLPGTTNDKDNPIVLVQVQQIPGTNKYDFVPIQP